MEQNETLKQIYEINESLRGLIQSTSDFMINADADAWSYLLKYYPEDVVRVTLIFQHVCSNVGIKSKVIDDKNAHELGERLRNLVKDMTGLDTIEIIEKMKS